MTSNLENMVLNGIKYFQAEYADGVPVSIMKLDLGLSDDDLRETLLNLEDQGAIFIEGERIKVIEESAGDDSELNRDDSGVIRDDSGVIRDDSGVIRDDSGVIRDDSTVTEDDLPLNRDDLEVTRDDSRLEEADGRAVMEKGKTKDITENLTKKEQQAFDIIKELAGDSGRVSRHILEGNLLYGDLKLTNLGIYNLVKSLEIKGIIKKIQMVDGEYYVI